MVKGWEDRFLNKVVCGDCLELMKGLPDGIVDCVMTSPPYWGLRDYKLEPQVWDGDGNCEHRWGKEFKAKQSGGGWAKGKPEYDISKDYQLGERSQGNFCSLCGAWRGSLGLEPTFELYLEHLLSIFDEVRRVLKPTGTVWVNLGDSYSNESGIVGRQDKSKYGGKSGIHCLRGGDKSVSAKSLCLIPQRFAIGMVEDDNADEYELRDDLSEKEKEYILSELTKRNII